MTVKTEGIEGVQTMLRHVGDRVPDLARGFMRRAAARIVKRAQVFVPEDTTALRESIRIEKTYGGRGRLQIDVIAGGATVELENGRIVDLDQYAALIHERYSSMTPGERTLAKMRANPGVLIGERYLERAADEEEVGLEARMMMEITRVLRELETT